MCEIYVLRLAWTCESVWPPFASSYVSFGLQTCIDLRVRLARTTVSERCLVPELKLFWFMCLGKRVWAAHTLMVWGIFFIVSKFTTPEFPLWLFFSLFFLSDNRSGVCYRSVTASGCGEPFKRVSKKDVCCCSVGAAWGKPCEECPLLNTGAPVVLWLQESALC